MAELRLTLRADDTASKVLDGATRSIRKTGAEARKMGPQVARGAKQADTALKRTGKQAKATAASAKALTGAVASLKTAMLGLIGIAAVVRTVQGVTAALADEENAIRRLNAVLEQNGEFTEENSRALVERARVLSAQTAIEKEVILNGFALARAFSNSTEGAAKLTEAALDFGVAADLQFSEAVRRLGRAVRGSAADVANFAPEIRDLTKAQLAAGRATDIIGEKFRGAARAQAETLGGKIRQLSVNFKELAVAAGEQARPGIELVIDSLDRLIVSTDKALRFGTEFVSVEQEIIDAVEKSKDVVAAQIATFERFGKVAPQVLQQELRNIEAGIEAERERLATRLETERRTVEARKKTGEQTVLLTQQEKDAREKAERDFQKAVVGLQIERLQLADQELEAARIRTEQELIQRVEAFEKLGEAAGLSSERIREAVAGALDVAREKFAELDRQGSLTFQSLQAAGEAVAGEIESRFSKAFSNLILEGQSLGESLKGIFKSVADIAIQEIARVQIRRAIAAGGGGLPGALPFLAGIPILGGILGGIFQHGTRRVPGPVGQPQVGILHGGETVNTFGAPAGAGRVGGSPAPGGTTVNLTVQVTDLNPPERRRLLQALTDEIRAATDEARQFAAETEVLTSRVSGAAS